MVLASAPLTGAGAASRTVTDMAGRTVAVPDNPRRVACFEVLCYEKFFLLGAADRVADMYRTDPPWMRLIDPKAAERAKVEGVANREQLLGEGIDLVFLRYDPAQLAGLAAVGLTAVVSQPPLTTAFANVQEFTATQKRMVRLFAQIIGGDAVARAERWCADYDARIAFVTARLADLPKGRRRRAYYLRGPAAVNTQGPTSNTYWYGMIGGANMIVEGTNLIGPAPMAIEEILRRDPEFIFVGRQYSPDLVLKDPAWQGVTAVKRGEVLQLPDGFFYWDGSTEGGLLAELIAKTLYPDRFRDLDIGKEVQDYYRTFYGFTFTPKQLQNFLAGLTPEGVRRGY
jgi:iron complex transport system substrate-binding protein